MKKVLAVLAVAGLASSAMAQSFEARIAFTPNHTLGAPTATEMTVATGDAINIAALFGAFNATGFTRFNAGMFNFLGNISINDPAGVASVAPRSPVALRSPYDFGNIVNQVTPTTIAFDANRSTGAVGPITWNEGQPAPADVYTYGPNEGGPNSLFQGFRMVLNPVNNTARTITITVSGPMQAVDGWFVTGGFPPDDGEPGQQSLLPGGFVTSQGSATFLVHVIPAPGALALLGLGGLVATRRRR